jgi:hypothetical protein
MMKRRNDDGGSCPAVFSNSSYGTHCQCCMLGDASSPEPSAYHVVVTAVMKIENDPFRSPSTPCFTSSPAMSLGGASSAFRGRDSADCLYGSERGLKLDSALHLGIHSY